MDRAVGCKLGQWKNRHAKNLYLISKNHILDGTVASVTMLEGYSVLMAQIENAKELLDQYNIDYAALLADLEETYNSGCFQ